MRGVVQTFDEDMSETELVEAIQKIRELLDG
jgi:hypothetical protein